MVPLLQKAPLQQFVGGPGLLVGDVGDDGPEGLAQRLGKAALLPTPSLLRGEADIERPSMEAREGREDEGPCLARNALPQLLF